jgi:hypothetical protein
VSPPFPIPSFLRHLPVNSRGWPVPFFALDPENLARIDNAKLRRAVVERRCWICGHKLRRQVWFVLGPAQVATRRYREPPVHAGCARFAVTVCPFLTHPDYRRQTATDVQLPHAVVNPGCFALWRTDLWLLAEHGQLAVGDPTAPVRWVSCGGPASHAQVLAAFDPYRPLLDAADFEAAMRWLPR